MPRCPAIRIEKRLALGLALGAAGCVGSIAHEGPSAQDGTDGGVSGTGGSSPAGDGGEVVQTGPIDFFRDIQPILTDNCVRCHGGVRELGNLNLQSRTTALRVLSPAQPAASILMVRVNSADVNARMPLGAQPLLPVQIGKLKRWIDEGAQWPQHWSFAPLADVQPAQVVVKDTAWVRTPVDSFILSALEKQGIKPSPPADLPTLIRRVSLDLTGLPPTPKEVDDFVGDATPTAYEKVVDRLLAAPGFGERWGRHWLDQARYADSDGYEKDTPRPDAWRWRDWVVDAINKDVPFDQFTTDQIAGDLQPGATALKRLGTAFHNQTMYNREGGVDPEEDRTKRVIDRVATVGNVWLGLTLQCTQCHSHPYDQLAQKEFYKMFAFFNNADESTTTVPMSSNPADPQTMSADVMAELTSNRRSTYLLTRGNFLTPDTTAGVITPGTMAALPPFAPRGAQPDRLDLARWLVDAKNPLTPRVFVNTVWYHLFGEGLVATLTDFGTRARVPAHPELLDWLAGDFVKGGWKRKRLIKEIVMSATYRQASAFRPEVTQDPGNALYHRQNRIRVEAEIVTDINLAVSGLLSAKRGGPAVFPPFPDELRDAYRGPYADNVWMDSTGQDRYRRGLYTFHRRSVAYPNLEIFDWPGAGASLTRRARTDTPLQALTLLHNVVFDEVAQALGRRVQVDKPGSLDDQVVWAFRLAVARTPSATEAAELVSLYNDAKKLHDASPANAPKVVGNYQPPGVGVTEAAAWVATARAILNLDELITRE